VDTKRATLAILGTIATNKIYIREEIKSRINVGDGCHHKGKE
jgi:hypothetical protein